MVLKSNLHGIVSIASLTFVSGGDLETGIPVERDEGQCSSENASALFSNANCATVYYVESYAHIYDI